MAFFKVYHNPDCPEAVKLFEVMDKSDLQYRSFVIGEDVTQEEYDAIMDEYCDSVELPIRNLPRILQSNDADGEWINMGSAEDVIPFLLKIQNESNN